MSSHCSICTPTSMSVSWLTPAHSLLSIHFRSNYDAEDACSCLVFNGLSLPTPDMNFLEFGSIPDLYVHDMLPLSWALEQWCTPTLL